MDEFRKKFVDEQVGGKSESIKGQVKEELEKLFGDEDLEAEGQAAQAEGSVREQAGKAGRATSDATECIKDKLRGYEE